MNVWTSLGMEGVAGWMAKQEVYRVQMIRRYYLSSPVSVMNF